MLKELTKTYINVERATGRIELFTKIFKLEEKENLQCDFCSISHGLAINAWSPYGFSFREEALKSLRGQNRTLLKELLEEYDVAYAEFEPHLMKSLNQAS